MNPRPAIAAAAASVLVAALAAGCSGPSPAERAIASAEASWAGIRDRVRHVSPQRAADIELALGRARTSARRGDWVGALAAVQALPIQIRALEAELEAGNRALDARWDSTNAGLARALPEIDRGIERVAAARPLPAGVTAADVAGARSELAAARVAWTQAVSAREDRRWDEAMRLAGQARLRARRAGEAVGLPPPRDLQRPSG